MDSAQRSRERLDSLDVFRGMTIAAMILVSTPGTWTSVYAQLDHAAWNGWTFTDLVFPFFLFAMGAAVPFALGRRRNGGAPLWSHVLRRAAVLFALGFVLNAIETTPPLAWATFRIPGVLQRIAIVYLAIAWLTERSLRVQIACAAAALLGYWAAMMLVPVPGAGAGVLTPAGNLASYVDRALLGRHILTKFGDPEGLLSTLPSIATALCGVFAGVWLHDPSTRSGRDGHTSAGVLWLGGFAVMLAGLAWARAFPLNKNLWTSSFAIFTAGLAAQLLALLHWIVDLRGWRAWAKPFTAFGRNALATYFLSVGLDSLLTRVNTSQGSLKFVIYRATFVAWMRPAFSAETASMAYAIAYVVLWGIVLVELHRRRLFLSV